MKNFSTWMIVLFMIMFWIFRIVVMLGTELKWDMAGLTVLNKQMEIALLFIVLVCIILIVKRKMLGGLIYLLAYGMYFGTDLVSNAGKILLSVTTDVDLGAYLNIFVSLIGVIIPIAVIFDLIMDRSRKLHPKDKKTDWFYTNEQFDRKLDERADRNNYRNY